MRRICRLAFVGTACALSFAVHSANSQELLLIPDSFGNRVMSFDAQTGNLLDPNFIPPDPVNLDSPIEVLLSPSGRTLLISDENVGVVQEFDFNGNYLGVFAPAGGPNFAILDNPRGMAYSPTGNLLVVSAAGGNTNAVVEFDTQGNYVGRLVNPGAGGLNDPMDIIARGSDYLVTGTISDAIHRFDANGAPLLPHFATLNTFPAQMHETVDGRIFVANNNGTQLGIHEFGPTGTHLGGFYTIGDYRGAYQLQSGNLIVSTGYGVYELTHQGGYVSTKINGIVGTYITYVDLPILGDPLHVTDLKLGLDFANRARRNNEDVDKLSIRGSVNPEALVTAGVDLMDFQSLSASIAIDGTGTSFGPPTSVSEKRVSWLYRDPGGSSTRITLNPITGAFSLSAKKIDMVDLNDPRNATLQAVIPLSVSLGFGPWNGTQTISGPYSQKAPNAKGKYAFRWARTGGVPSGTFFVKSLRIEQKDMNGTMMQRASLVASIRSTGNVTVDPTDDTSPIEIEIGDFQEGVLPTAFQASRNGFAAEDPTGNDIERFVFDSRRWTVTVITNWVDASSNPFGVALTPVLDEDTDPRTSVNVPIEIVVDGERRGFIARAGRNRTSFVTGVPNVLR